MRPPLLLTVATLLAPTVVLAFTPGFSTGVGQPVRWKHPQMNMSMEPPEDWLLLHGSNTVFLRNDNVEDEFRPWLRLSWYPDIPSATEVADHLRDEIEGSGQTVEEMSIDQITLSGWPTDRIRARVRTDDLRWSFQALMVRVRGRVGHGYFILSALAERQEDSIGPILQKTVDSMQLGDNEDSSSSDLLGFFGCRARDRRSDR